LLCSTRVKQTKQDPRGPCDGLYLGRASHGHFSRNGLQCLTLILHTLNTPTKSLKSFDLLLLSKSQTTFFTVARNAGPISFSGTARVEANISYHRAACAGSVKLWQAVDDALDPKNWDVNKWTREKNRVFCCIVGLCVNIASELEPVVEEEEFLPFFVESSPYIRALISRGRITNRIRQMMKHVNMSPTCSFPFQEVNNQ